MDPDAALDELLGLVNLMTRLADAGISEQIDRDRILRMTELMEALDSWLTAGGFLPLRWKAATRRSG